MQTYGCNTFEVTPGALPEGVQLQPGDVIALYADLESKKESKAGAAYVLTLRALDTVTRGGRVVWPRP